MASNGSYENRSYSTVAYPTAASTSRSQTMEDSVMTTKTEVFIREDGISLKQPNFTMEEVEESVRRILDWVHGPGTKLLQSQRDLPRNFKEAEAIRKGHEQFEFKCMQALANYAKLRDIKTDDNEIAECIEKLEITMQDFLRRLQNRRNVVVSLYTFFRLQQELESYLLEIRKILQLEFKLSIEETESRLSELERCFRFAENLYQQLYLESQRISTIIDSQEILTIVIKYIEDIRPRLGQQLEQLKIRILETKRYLQLLVYERDSRQSVVWLHDLFRIVIDSYFRYNIGKTPMETQQLLQQNSKLQSKSKETHEYGLEMVNSLEQQQRDQGKPTAVCQQMRGELKENWQRLMQILVEVQDRYTAADAFHQNVDLNLERIEKLILLICRDLDAGITLEDVRKTYSNERNDIVRAYESTKKIGIGLMERIKSPVAEIQSTINPQMINEVIDVIKVKLFTLWLKIRELYYYLGQVIEVTDITERWQMIRISIDKLYERMLYWEARWKEGALPFTIPEAEQLISQHNGAKEEIRRLWQEVASDLEKLMRESDNMEVAKMAEQAMNDAENKRKQWMQRWEIHMDMLDMRYQLLLRLRDMELEVDDLHNRLRDVEQETVEVLSVVSSTVQFTTNATEAVPEVRQKMQQLFKETRSRVSRDFERHINPIEEKWAEYVKELELFQMFIDTVHRMLIYIDELYAFIEELNRELPKCNTREQADPWLEKIRQYNRKTDSFDCDWLQNVAERLYGSPSKPQPVIEKLRHIGARLRSHETYILEMVTVETVTIVQAVRVERKFFRDLADLTLPEGNRCELEVEYSTPGDDVKVEWRRKGRPLQTVNMGGNWQVDEQDGFTSATCEKIRIEDGGQYSCVITDSEGSMETDCRLRVVAPPRFIKELTPQKLEQDQKLQLLCQVQGSPLPRIQWLKDNQLIKNNFEYNIQQDPDGECKLIVDKVNGSHAGLFRCKATNEAGEASTIGYVEVKEYKMCQFLRPLSDQTKSEEERLRLFVEFEGDPEPEVQWFRDATSLRTSGRCTITTGPSSSSCVIDPLRLEDEGLYSVQIRNPAGVKKSVANLTVNRPVALASRACSPISFVATEQATQTAAAKQQQQQAQMSQTELPLAGRQVALQCDLMQQL